MGRPFPDGPDVEEDQVAEQEQGITVRDEDDVTAPAQPPAAAVGEEDAAPLTPAADHGRAERPHDPSGPAGTRTAPSPPAGAMPAPPPTAITPAPRSDTDTADPAPSATTARPDLDTARAAVDPDAEPDAVVRATPPSADTAAAPDAPAEPDTTAAATPDAPAEPSADTTPAPDVPAEPDPDGAATPAAVDAGPRASGSSDDEAAAATPGTPGPAEPAPAGTPGAASPVASTATPTRPGAVGPRPSRPRPGDRPRSKPAAVAATPAAAPQPSPVAVASGNPSHWGRVDEAGVVHVRTADGERVVGSWQAGAPDEGLAHFARRFDDLATEVELLFHRLTAGGDPKQALGSARSLREGLPEATVVGDLAGLGARLGELVTAAETAVGAARAARDTQRRQAVTRKEELAAEAEALSTETTQWKQAGDRFTAILDEWRTIRGIERKVDEALWKRFSHAREAFNRRRGSHFADLDRQRSSAKHRKEDLVVEAEKLADSQDWGPTAARLRDLMTEWKAAGRTHKDADDTLWQRFRTAQDAFFAHRSANLAERDAEFATNAEAKKVLLTEAEKIDISEPGAARVALRAVQERWEAIGKVPRDDIRALEARLRGVEERVREAADRQWRRTDPEAEARVAQFRERVAQFETQAAKARAAGDTKRAGQADAQAAQWREWLETAEQAVQHR